MPSTTRGSILISTANDIGTTLVDKLGGTGYTPDEWDSAANLCGIASADIETALENITESTPQGAERGSMSIAKANSIGSVLNKKFNTSRGFKPSEWASAISFLEPLPERTASGSIAHIEDGADAVPLKNWLVTLPASLSGYSEVNGVKAGKNLIKPDRYQTAANNLALGQNDGTSFGTFLKAGTYTISYTTTGETCYIYRREENDASNTNMGKRLNVSFTLENDGNFRFWLYGDGAVAANISNVQIEVGSTATAYEAYTSPTTYTASLGRTIYGGTADIVTGEGSNGSILIDLSELSWNMDNDTHFRSRQTDYTGASGWSGNWQNTVSNRFVCENPATAFTNRSDYSFANIPQNYYNFDIKVPTGIFADANAFKAWLANIDGNNTHAVVVIDRLNAETFTFTPITPTPETALGVNNFWADEGDSSVVYRADIDLAQ